MSDQNIASRARAALDAGEGILRLAPTWVPRSFLMPGGRLAVVAFHSLEDARVKSFLRHRSGTATGGSRHLPPPAGMPRASFHLLTRRAMRPSLDEIARNPRARSARCDLDAARRRTDGRSTSCR